MPNTILIRRSTTAPDPGTILGTGELAYSYNSGKLYIGSQNSVGNPAVAIGGPGVLALYAPLENPMFIGDPQAPTPTLSDNDTSIATTAFVKGQGYLTNNQNITISGDATGNGSTAITLTLGNTGVTAGTYTKLTVDSKGRATLGSSLTATDIPTITASKISDFDTQVRTNRLDQLAAPTSSVSYNNQRITSVADPTSPQDVATKAYVDAARSGLDVKASVRVATIANISLSAPGSSIDGVTLTSGNRVLVKNQTTASENGIYVFQGASSLMTRATDADTNTEVNAGLFTFVEEGTIHADTGWVLLTDDPIVLNTTGLSFGQFSGAGTIAAGNGLTKSGNTLSVLSVNSGRIEVSSNGVDLATVGTAGSYRTVTTDAYGRITTGSNPTTLAGYGITDAQPLDSDLSAIAALASNGIIVKTGSSTAAVRAVSGTTNRVTVIDGDGVSGNPTIDIASSYIGQASITTLGTIASGVWQGTAVGLAYGGTGNTTFAANNIPYSDGTKLNSVSDLTWNNSSKTLTVAGSLDGCTINGGTF